MGGYDRDEYEDLDEYEEEEEDKEQEEEVGEDEEEGAQLPQQESVEFLELRQKLKEKHRKKMKDSSAALANSREKKNKLPYNNFGSFFGPSQPVIAQRVIQESKSLLENPHLVARVSKANNNGRNKVFASAPVSLKPQSNNRPPEVTIGLKPKEKIQMLKNTRDYSFLSSDNAKLPAPTKDPPRSVSVPKSVVQLAQRTPSNIGRKVLNGHEERKPMPIVSQMRVKVGPLKPKFSSKPNSTSVDSRKQLGSNNGSGPGRPLGPKGLPSKTPMATKEKSSSALAAKSSVPGVRKTLPSKSPALVPKQPLEQKREYIESSKGKMMTKQSVLSSQPQIKQQPARCSARATLQEDRPKKRPVQQSSNGEDDDDGDAISIIRGLFGYNPSKYHDDDDDRNMEAGFDDIQKEERRSSKIANKEDEEELHKIEEEERRERMRKEAKKRKLSR